MLTLCKRPYICADVGQFVRFNFKMPFVTALRENLLHLKEEYDCGILPLSIYEDLCRKAIAQFTEGPLIKIKEGFIYKD